MCTNRIQRIIGKLLEKQFPKTKADHRKMDKFTLGVYQISNSLLSPLPNAQVLKDNCL